MSLRNKRIAILNDSTKYGRLTIMQQPIVHTYSLGELYTERKEKGDPSLPILTVSIHAGVSEGELDEDKLGKKVKRIADKTQYKTARKGDLVFNMMRAWQGAIGVVRSDGLVSPAYIVAKPNEKIWPEYMDYCMKTPRMIHAIHRQSYGVTDFRLRLYWDSFTPITCQLPTLPEQQKIAAILSTQDKVIELKEKLLAQKQQQKKYLMQQLLTGKKRLPGFDRKWNYVKANEIFKSIVDKSHDGKLEVLSSTQDKGIVPRSQVDIDIKYNENSLSTYKKVCEGDFVISLRSFQGGIEYSNYAGIVSPAYTVLRAIVKIDNGYYKQFFKSSNYIKRLNVAVYGIRDGKQISYDDFGQIKIPVPPIEEQREVAKVLSTATMKLICSKSLLRLRSRRKKR